MRIVVPYSCPVELVVNLETGLVEDVVFYPDRLGLDDGPSRNYELQLQSLAPCRELRTEPLWPNCPTRANLQAQNVSPTNEDLRRATALAEAARLEQQLPDYHCE
jgi:hypothetical protein